MKDSHGGFSRGAVLALIALVVPTAATIPVNSHLVPLPGSSMSGMIIPLYIYPGAAWNTVLQVKQANPNIPITVIANPSNGPGASPDPNYAAWISRLQGRGISVLGYVYTSYGARSSAAVKADVLKFQQWYAVDGIFLDEMASSHGYEPYYASLTKYVHSLGLQTVVGNPGTQVPVSYYGTVDVLMIYESAGVPSLSTLATYTEGGAKGEFAVASYDVPKISSEAVSELSNYAGMVFVTDQNLPNPYGALPSYISTMASEMSSFFSGASTMLVQSVDVNNYPLQGALVTVSTTGGMVAEGYTPFEFMGTAGEVYNVSLVSSQSLTFLQWSGGSTKPSRSVVLSKPVALTGAFSPNYAVMIDSATLGGSPLPGLSTVVYYQGNVVQRGFTPMSYVGEKGAQYVFCVQNYQNDVFDHWEDGSTNPCRAITLSQSLEITASYST
jgi:Spherulation-specific family 4